MQSFQKWQMLSLRREITVSNEPISGGDSCLLCYRAGQYYSLLDQRLRSDIPEHAIGYSCWLGGRLFTPSAHPSCVFVSNPASAWLVLERRDAWQLLGGGPSPQRWG